MYTTTAGSNSHSTGLNSSNDRLAFDNLVRRELKVADPRNAREVADALLKRYKDDPRAAAMQQEALGLPFLQSGNTAPVVQVMPTASDKEWQQAVDDSERDLKALTTNTLLKDVMPELNGWTQAIRSTLQEVEGSARFALDPRQRDKTMALRRQLSDYARFSRLIGVLTPEANSVYRQLGMSLDEAAAVAMVRVGEALANAGFSGNYLLQAPYSELQSRRDAVVYALRGLSGSTQEAFTPSEWPRGLNAYRKLYEALEQQGQGELRSLLVENELARVMDDIIQRAGNGTAEGLRAAGATAEIDLLRFRRLIETGSNLVPTEAPQLTSFIEALQLFVDGFTASGGARLLRIARPPILLYGIYGSQGTGGADARMLRLVSLRNQLADELDCFADCGCDSGPARAALDLALHCIDRAIDLYAGGRESFGSSECRASAFAYLLMAVLDHFDPNSWEKVRALDERGKGVEQAIEQGIFDARDKLVAAQRWKGKQRKIKSALRLGRTMTFTTSSAQSVEQIAGILRQLVSTLAPFSIDANGSMVVAVPPDWPPDDVTTFNSSTSRELRAQELDLQGSVEGRWKGLVSSIAPGCAADGLILGPDGILISIIDCAVYRNDNGISANAATLARLIVAANTRTPNTSSALPPDLATIGDGFVNDVTRAGEGR